MNYLLLTKQLDDTLDVLLLLVLQEVGDVVGELGRQVLVDPSGGGDIGDEYFLRSSVQSHRPAGQSGALEVPDSMLRMNLLLVSLCHKDTAKGKKCII